MFFILKIRILLRYIHFICCQITPFYNFTFVISQYSVGWCFEIMWMPFFLWFLYVLMVLAWIIIILGVTECSNSTIPSDFTIRHSFIKNSFFLLFIFSWYALYIYLGSIHFKYHYGLMNYLNVVFLYSMILFLLLKLFQIRPVGIPSILHLFYINTLIFEQLQSYLSRD